MRNGSTSVLLIEDNPGDADLVRLQLVEGKSGVDVNCVDRLSDGLASLQEKSPSIILLDLNLPDSQGAETFRKVLQKAPDVPVVILSEQDDDALAIAALHQGVQDYLVKGAISSSGLDRAMRYAVERQALLRSLEMSRQQQLEFKNQFLSHVSHELRTPLTCIHQFATILRDGLAGEVSLEQHEHLETILKSVKQLSAMVRDLLEASRAEAGKVRIEPHCVSIGDVILLAVSMIRSRADEKHVGLEIRADDRLPFVYGDPDRILEILINLLDNAIKFTPSGGAVTIQSAVVPTDPDFIHLSVTDNGCGVDPGARALIFERMYQDPNSIVNSRKGLGLGLFIAKELVTLHGGRIWMAGEPGQGSTFTFTLPVYSLAKLLSSVLVKDGAMRDAVVLVRITLTAQSNLPRRNWNEICRSCLEILQRCVYPDKDLVLPPMTTPGPVQTYFVVASTDLIRAGIMMTRIREHLSKVPDLIASGALHLSASSVILPNGAAGLTLEQKVQTVAIQVTEMARSALATRQDSMKSN